MYIGIAVDRADLAAAEEAGQGHRSQLLGKDLGIVVGHPVETRAAAQAGEQQGAGRLVAALTASF